MNESEIMETMTFEELIQINCFSEEKEERKKAAELLEYRYGCEIRCGEMDKSVRFAHHARGCTIIADGAKILGPVIIGENTVIGAGAIITKDIPANSVAFGVNQYKPKNPDFDLIINDQNISGEEIMRINAERVAAFNQQNQR